MQNSNRSRAEQRTFRASSMIYLGKTWSFDARSIARRIAAVSLPVLAGVTLAMLVLFVLEVSPVTPAPVDRGHPWICECRQCCE
jgi:hypothetical protein